MWLVTPKGDMLNLAVAHEILMYRYSDDTAEVLARMPTTSVTIARGSAEHCEAAVEHVATGIASGWPVIYMNTKGA